jgi:hypothetical protein
LSKQVAVSLKDKSVNVVYAACEKGRTILQKTSVLEVPITFNMIRRNDAGTERVFMVEMARFKLQRVPVALVTAQT